MTEEFLAEIEVLSAMPPAVAIDRLRVIGEDAVADAVQQQMFQGPSSSSFAWPQLLGGAAPVWLHNSYAIGHIGVRRHLDSDLIPILPPGKISPDRSLIGKPLTLTLERLFVEKYPGNGLHAILVDIAIRDLESPSERIHFHCLCQALDGEYAGVMSKPLFVGVKVGQEGLALEMLTVNVNSQGDQDILRFAESSVFRAGLQLMSNVQPAVGLLSEVLGSIGKTVANRSMNVPVNKIDLGLDFGRLTTGVRLAEGSLIIVQVPKHSISSWDWRDWAYSLNAARITNRLSGDRLAFNHIIIGIRPVVLWLRFRFSVSNR